MNKKPLLFVANWKMQLSYNQAVAFVNDNLSELDALAEPAHLTVVLCPSFDALAPIAQITNRTHIGAQNCAPHAAGPYTGEVQAHSLSQIGCNFCIVGHSERRQLFHETYSIIQSKIEQLLLNTIIPILCIGETEQERENKQTEKRLHEQLMPLFELLMRTNHATICIAYEPVWAIGTNRTPTPENLFTIITYLQTLCKKQAPQTTFIILYGGSVNEQNIISFNALSGIDGFLIGNASTDFQKLKKIVSLYC